MGGLCVFDRDWIPDPETFDSFAFERNGEIDRYWVSGWSKRMWLELFVSTITRLSLSLSASRDPLIEILVPRREKERGSVSMSIEGDWIFSATFHSLFNWRTRVRKGVIVETCSFWNFFLISRFRFVTIYYSFIKVSIDVWGINLLYAFVK